MLKELLKKSLKLRASHVLTCGFLFFVFYVGFAALPQLLINAGNALQWRYDPATVIRTVDDQYGGMLEANPDKQLLQDKGTYINFNGLMAKAMDQPMMNERVTLKNGHLASLNSEVPEFAEIQAAADNLIRFYQKQTDNQGHFLFVVAPSQISKYEDLLPTGFTDSTNDTADTLLQLLEEADVPTLDLREHMQREGMTVTDAFFTTDHHWLPQTGFWAYTKILEKLEQLGAIGPVDAACTDMDNYTFETYPNTFLGSSGKRTGVYYAGTDDSIFIKPNFETEISLTVPERNLSLTGTYDEVCYNTDVVHNFMDPDFFNENMYGLYGWGDNQIAHWRNDRAGVQERVLMIGESFGNIPFSLMSIALSSCDEFDSRYYTGDFTAYYEDYAPETVVIQVNVGHALSEIVTYPYVGQ